ncbi:MAG: hypothetical protein WCB44_14415, partial [Stellaceae bacterium]
MDFPETILTSTFPDRDPVPSPNKEVPFPNIAHKFFTSFCFYPPMAELTSVLNNLYFTYSELTGIFYSVLGRDPESLIEPA